jgi:pimeloyl-ACP methyl ester carboxylesterase
MTCFAQCPRAARRVPDSLTGYTATVFVRVERQGGGRWNPQLRTEGDPVTKTSGTVWILASAALLAFALLLSVALPGMAAPPVAPKTLDLGKGPTIVLVHDLGGNRSVWMPTVRKLLGKHRVVMVDLPGHGESPAPDPFTFEAAAEALDLVLAKQNPDSTVLVGKGIGGMLALLDLKAHPGRVRGLVVIETPLKSPMKIDDQQIKGFLSMLDSNYDLILKEIFSKAGKDSMQGVTIHATAAQTPPQTIKSYIGASLTGDATAALKSLQVPFLFVATDRLFKSGKSPGTALLALGYEDTTSVTMRRIADAGYLVMQDQPDTLAAIIADFTARALATKKQ